MGNGAIARQNRFTFDEAYYKKILNQFKQGLVNEKHIHIELTIMCDYHQNKMIQGFCINKICKARSRRVCQMCVKEQIHGQDDNFQIEYIKSSQQIKIMIEYFCTNFLSAKLSLLNCWLLITYLRNIQESLYKNSDLEILQQKLKKFEQEFGFKQYSEKDNISLYQYFLESDQILNDIQFDMFITPNELQDQIIVQQQDSVNHKKVKIIQQILQNKAFKEKWIDELQYQQVVEQINSLLDEGLKKITNEKYLEAIENFDLIIDFGGNQQTEALYQKGICLYKLEQYENAQQIFNKLVTKYPGKLEYIYQVGCIQKKLNQYEESLKSFIKTNKILQTHVQSYFKKVNLYFKLKKLDQIINFDKEIKNVLQEYDIKNLQGYVLLKQQKYKEASTIFKNQLQVDGKSNFVLKQLGKIYFQVRKFEDGLQYYNQILDIQPNNYFATKYIGMVNYNQQQFQEAIKRFDKCIKLKNNQPSTLGVKILKLQSVFQLANYEESIKFSSQLINYDPKTVYWIIAQSYFQLKKYNECKDTLILLLSLDKQNRDAIHLIGSSYYYLYEYQLCIDSLEPIIQQYPNSVEILGLSYLNQSQYRKALLMLNKAIEIDKNFLFIYIEIERNFYQNGHYDESHIMLEKLVELYPQQNIYQLRLGSFNKIYQFYVGIGLFYKKIYDSAIYYMISNKNINTNSIEVDIYICISFYKLMQYQEVINYCSEILSQTNNEIILKLMALSYLQLRQYTECELYLHKIIKMETQNEQAKYYLAISLYQRQSYQEALSIFYEINKEQDNIDYLLQQGKCLYQLQCFQEAIEILNYVIQKQKSNYEAIIFLAQCHFSLNNYMKAISITQPLLDFNIQDKTILLEIQGLSHYFLSKFDNALRIFDELISQNDQNHHALYYKGLSLQKLTYYKDSVNIFQKVILIDPLKLNVYYNLGMSLYQLHKYQDSYMALVKAKLQDPLNSEINMLIVKSQFQLQNYDQVIQICDEIIYLQQDKNIHQFASVMKGLSLSLQGNYIDALKIIASNQGDPLIQINETSDSGMFNVTYSAYPFDYQYQYQQYLNIAKQVIHYDDKNINALKLMGLSYYKLKYYSEAITYFKQSIEIDPQNKESYQKAIQASNAAIQLEPSQIQQFNQKAILLCQDKQYEKAFEIFQKVINVDPLNIMAKTYIGQILCQQKEYENAIQIIEQVLDQNPEYSHALYMKGIILYKQRLFQESLTIFLILQSLEPHNLNIKNNIAQLYLNLNDTRQAVQISDEILQIDPQFMYSRICIAKSKKRHSQLGQYY